MPPRSPTRLGATGVRGQIADTDGPTCGRPEHSVPRGCYVRGQAPEPATPATNEERDCRGDDPAVHRPPSRDRPRPTPWRSRTSKLAAHAAGIPPVPAVRLRSRTGPRSRARTVRCSGRAPRSRQPPGSRTGADPASMTTTSPNRHRPARSRRKTSSTPRSVTVAGLFPTSVRWDQNESPVLEYDSTRYGPTRGTWRGRAHPAPASSRCSRSRRRASAPRRPI